MAGDSGTAARLVELSLADQQHVVVARVVADRQPEQFAAAEARGVQEDDRQAKDLRAERTCGRGGQRGRRLQQAGDLASA